MEPGSEVSVGGLSTGCQALGGGIRVARGWGFYNGRDGSETCRYSGLSFEGYRSCRVVELHEPGRGESARERLPISRIVGAISTMELARHTVFMQWSYQTQYIGSAPFAFTRNMDSAVAPSIITKSI